MSTVCVNTVCAPETRGHVTVLQTLERTIRPSNLNPPIVTIVSVTLAMAALASKEAEQMKQYLLLPARLPDIFTLEQFRAMFPRAARSSPHIKTLYRDLQAQRAALVDSVSASIDAHAKDGRLLRHRLKLRQDAEATEAAGGDDVELEVERAMFGGNAAGLRPRLHTLQTIVPALEGAVRALETEIASLEDEEKQLTDHVQATVSSLSDLRYGKPENAKLGEEVLEALEAFRAACKDKS